ncbi:MAG: hypothetical protein H6Q15_1764 [Bacteroidetes bacterium]|nr:hypothetical protein [Bacteroidota bacterium]
MTIDLTDRLYSAFGFIPSGVPRIATIANNIVAGVENANNIAENKINQSIIASNMQRYSINKADRSFADLTLKHGNKIFKFANTILTDNIDGVLATTPMVSFTRSKNIITTDVDGSDSQVVESFGLKPWDINIEGILVDMSEHQYPSSKLQLFREMFEINAIFEVIDSQILADLGILSIYIETISELKMVEGYDDTVKYKMKAVSIKPLEFFI